MFCLIFTDSRPFSRTAVHSLTRPRRVRFLEGLPVSPCTEKRLSAFVPSGSLTGEPPPPPRAKRCRGGFRSFKKRCTRSKGLWRAYDSSTTSAMAWTKASRKRRFQAAYPGCSERESFSTPARPPCMTPHVEDTCMQRRRERSCACDTRCSNGGAKVPITGKGTRKKNRTERSLKEKRFLCLTFLSGRHVHPLVAQAVPSRLPPNLRRAIPPKSPLRVFLNSCA